MAGFYKRGVSKNLGRICRARASIRKIAARASFQKLRISPPRKFSSPTSSLVLRQAQDTMATHRSSVLRKRHFAVGLTVIRKRPHGGFFYATSFFIDLVR